MRESRGAKPELAGRVDTERNPEGVDGRKRAKRGQGGRRTAGETRVERGEWRGGGGREDRRKPGTSRFCYDQWQTGTQPRAVRIDPRETTTLDSLLWSASLFARVTSSVLGEDPSSSSFFRLGPPGRAVFSFCPCDLSPGLSSSRFFPPFLHRPFAS